MPLEELPPLPKKFQQTILHILLKDHSESSTEISKINLKTIIEFEILDKNKSKYQPKT